VTKVDDTRSALVDNLDETLFVEAGAGSGKTSCLVNRFVALVESGVPADRVAAITYTTKAANELVERIRATLEKRAREGNDRCQESLALLDRAAICTVHSFAQRILTAHPIEAGLPPSVNVVEDIAASVAFESRWEDYVDALLADPEMERPVRLLLASGGSVDNLRSIAVAFNENWDLVAGRAGPQAPPIPPLDVSNILDGLADVISVAEECTDEQDKLLVHIAGRVTEFAHALRQAIDDDAKLELLAEPKLKKRSGRAGNWPETEVAIIRERLLDLHTACESLVERFQDAALQVLASSLAAFTIDGAKGRRAGGELEFHDLLVLVRSLLRDSVRGPVVRAALAKRYQRLLIDEFQDTDPIQVELAVLIASDDPDAGSKDWRTVIPRPGHLFFVGDPKQAIYRFRRADIANFLDTRDKIVGSAETLDRNYRTAETILDWVNVTFSQLIVEAPGSQPRYTALNAVRKDPETGPAVAFIGREHEGAPKAEVLRRAEAHDVAGVILQAVGNQWTVSERLSDGTEERRPARWSDIAILLPSRTSLPELQSALEAAEIPYRVETSTLVYGTREVRDLMLVMRAIDDPTDSLSVVSALRSPSFGCGDDDLLIWKRRYGGSWDYLNSAPSDAPLEHPVALGLARLRRLHEERRWRLPSETLDALLREGRFFELGAAVRRPRDVWRRLRFVLDQCRAWEEAGGVTLRRYLGWIASQSVQGKRASETVLPETDDDAVRILTIFGAKGLEFPITVVSGMTSPMVKDPGGVQVRFPDSAGWAIQLKKGFATADFEGTVAGEEQRERDERIRLLYVATTRARDHLVVSVHRKEADGPAVTSAEVLYEAGWDPARVELVEIPDELPPQPVPARGAPEPRGALPSLGEWRRQHETALAAASRPTAMSATALAAEEFIGVDDDERPSYRRTGGDGAAIGRAVHAVMQSIDLATAAGLSDACSAQAAAEGVGGRFRLIEELCRSALDSELVKGAAQRRHFREVYVGVPDSDRVLEGFIDLLYEDGEGIAIVDYKTDSWKDAAELDAKVERYQGQMRAYAYAVRESVGRKVVSATLLFLSRDGAVARSVGL
jgi:ATP-dependent exoDNAse (exonuclease V) beta subunit